MPAAMPVAASALPGGAWQSLGPEQSSARAGPHHTSASISTNPPTSPSRPSVLILESPCPTLGDHAQHRSVHQMPDQAEHDEIDPVRHLDEQREQAEHAQLHDD